MHYFIKKITFFNGTRENHTQGFPQKQNEKKKRKKKNDQVRWELFFTVPCPVHYKLRATGQKLCFWLSAQQHFEERVRTKSRI